jgi:TonB family protein
VNFAFDVVIRSAVILLCAGLMSLPLRRTSAAVRHGVWTAAIVAALLLPIVMRTLPGIAVPVQVVLPYASSVAVQPASVEVNGPNSLEWRSSQEEATRTSHKLTFVIVGWLAGFLFVLSRFALGARAIRRLWRNAIAAGFGAQVSELKALLGIRISVEAAISERPISPMAWGILRPVIILPPDFSLWPESRRCAVLAHELAHIRRNDGFLQLLGQLFCAVYWFNPIAWWAVHRMRIEREHACDDQVIGIGIDPTDYAADLLQIARNLQQPEFAAAVSMADRSELETRLIAILNPHVKRARPSRCTTAALYAAVAAILALAIIQPAKTAPLASAVLTTQSAGSALTPPRIIGVIVQPAYTAEAFERFIEGTVRLEGTVDTAGNTTNLHVVKGLGFGLDESALSEVANWKFTPGLRNGAPVQTSLDIDVDFKLAKAGIPLAAGIDSPVIVSRIEPGVTEEARTAKARGTVILEVTVRVDGTVDVVRVIQPLGYGLTESAIQALRQWTFEPAKKDGQRLPVRMNISISFDWR